MFKKNKTKVTRALPQAEILSVHVKIRTPVGEFFIDHPIVDDDQHPVLNPGDSIDLHWTWKGFQSGD